MTIVAPPRMWVPGWKGGAVVAPWTSRRVLDGVADDLGANVRAVCVIEAAATDHARWRAARGARDLRRPDALARRRPGGPPRGRGRDGRGGTGGQPQQRAHADRGQGVPRNHAAAARRPPPQVRVDDLCNWAAGNGFTAVEVKNLRNIAQRVLDGRSFRLGSTYGPGCGAVERWRDVQGA